MMESVPEALRPIQQWLGQHGMELTAVNSIDETSITVHISLSGRSTRKLQLHWKFLLVLNPEEIKDYLERHDFAAQLRRGDLYISHSAPRSAPDA